MPLRRSTRRWKNFIHALLRTYEGIFDQPVPIRERQLAWNIHAEPAQCRRTW